MVTNSKPNINKRGILTVIFYFDPQWKMVIDTNNSYLKFTRYLNKRVGEERRSEGGREMDLTFGEVQLLKVSRRGKRNIENLKMNSKYRE